MQIHTFIADSANEAVARIRSELGPSAVVLSVRKLPRTGLERLLKQDQIEVLAGVDDSPAPQSHIDPLAELRAEIRQLREQISRQPAPASREFRGLPERRTSAIAHLLNQTGMLPAFTELVMQEMPETDSLAMPARIQQASGILRRRWRTVHSASEANVHIFVGVPASGKSTVLCKMLAQTSLVESQPATVYQLDSHIANASPLPGVYAEIVGAQFERVAPFDFERREESVYVDLPGVPLHNTRALAQLRDLIESFGIPEVHLVLNAAYESAHLLEQVRFFSSLGISDLILTHLDEEARWGKIWNLVLGTNLNILSLATGQNIPGDIHPANPEVIFSRQFAGI